MFKTYNRFALIFRYFVFCLIIWFFKTGNFNSEMFINEVILIILYVIFLNIRFDIVKS